ncbi:MAG: CoA transferase, partial [Acetobacteraceae bacterium]|nr:CoA transferase [Acetobacteraceae bacterium]
QMGTGFLTQASNKRSSALDLKGEEGREAIRRLESDKAREEAVLGPIMLTRTAAVREEYLQSRHVPAARVRPMREAAADPQRVARGVTCRHQGATGVDSGFGVPLAAFTFAHPGPRIGTPPPALGEHTDAVLAEIGCWPAGIARLRAAKVI